MKKIFFICCVSFSALAVTTSANLSKQQILYNRDALNDTVPNSLDTMHNNWNADTMNNNMMDTSMNMHRDSTKPAPPEQ